MIVIVGVRWEAGINRISKISDENVNKYIRTRRLTVASGDLEFVSISSGLSYLNLPLRGPEAVTFLIVVGLGFLRAGPEPASSSGSWILYTASIISTSSSLLGAGVIRRLLC